MHKTNKYITEDLKFSNQTIKEIPVTYKERSGESKITKDFLSTAILALKMIKLIILIRISSFIN